MTLEMKRLRDGQNDSFNFNMSENEKRKKEKKNVRFQDEDQWSGNVFLEKNDEFAVRKPGSLNG